MSIIIHKELNQMFSVKRRGKSESKKNDRKSCRDSNRSYRAYGGDGKKLSILNPNNRLARSDTMSDLITQNCSVLDEHTDYEFEQYAQDALNQIRPLLGSDSNPNSGSDPSQLLRQIQEIIHKVPKKRTHQVNNLDYYQQALTHRSYVVIDNPDIKYEQIPDCIPLQPKSNETLEFLGDAVLGSIVSSYIYHRYIDQDEGFLTKLKTKLVRKGALARFSRFLDVGQMMLISKHVEEICNGRDSDRLLEDVFESLIGAIFEDIYQNNLQNFGTAMQTCCDFIVSLMEQTIDFRDLIANDDNYKEQLLQHFQKNFDGIHPVYHQISVEGPTNNRIYTMGVYHPENERLLIGRGTAKKKVDAEQIASQKAVEYFARTNSF